VGNLGDEPRRSIVTAGGKLHALPLQRAHAKLRRGRHHCQQPDETEGDKPGKPAPVWSAECRAMRHWTLATAHPPRLRTRGALTWHRLGSLHHRLAPHLIMKLLLRSV